jgi:lysophosphatidylcholine acyltransferase/lyso-PAF acetyltransferase
MFVTRGAGSGDGAVAVAPSRPSSADSRPPTPPVAGGGGVAAAIAARAGDPRFPPVAVAPEGTTKSGACLTRFRTGAFVPGAPVLPVLFYYGDEGQAPAFPLRPPASFHPGWGRVSSALSHFARSQAAPRNALAVRVLPLYEPSAAERADPAVYAENVRHHMAAALGVPPVSAGIEEWAALKAAGICTDALGRRVLWRPGGPGSPLVELEGGVGAVRAAAREAGGAGVVPARTGRRALFHGRRRP